MECQCPNRYLLNGQYAGKYCKCKDKNDIKIEDREFRPISSHKAYFDALKEFCIRKNKQMYPFDDRITRGDDEKPSKEM